MLLVKSMISLTVRVSTMIWVTTSQTATELIHLLKTMGLAEFEKGFSFTNLVDFDALYGHRRNAHGYRDCLHEFDERLPEIIAAMRENDLLLITADHGNDPTYAGTDHTREYIPLLAYSPCL